MEDVTKKEFKAVAAASAWEVVSYIRDHFIPREDLVQIVQTDNTWMIFYYG